MDYSLLVGKDETTNKLVVGIIDYLRPFSLDKLLESQVNFKFKIMANFNTKPLYAGFKFITRPDILL